MKDDPFYDWDDSKPTNESSDKTIQEEEPRKGPPVLHIFTPEQEMRYGVGPRLDNWSDPNNNYNPADFIIKGVR